jgi:hypothetical protein
MFHTPLERQQTSQKESIAFFGHSSLNHRYSSFFLASVAHRIVNAYLLPIPMRFLSILTVLSISFFPPIATFADDEQPIAGKAVFENFKKEIAASKFVPPSLSKIYGQPLWGTHVIYPEEWTYREESKTMYKLGTAFIPMMSEKQTPDGSIYLSALKKTESQSVAMIEKYFKSNAYLSDSPMIGDWFIPSMGNLETSDVTINGGLGKQFMFTINRGDHYIGINRIFLVGNIIYSFEMTASPQWAEEIYAIYESMSKQLKIGAPQQVKERRTKTPVQTKRFAIPALKSSSSSSSSSVRPAKARVSSSKSSVRPVRGSAASAQNWR